MLDPQIPLNRCEGFYIHAKAISQFSQSLWYWPKGTSHFHPIYCTLVNVCPLSEVTAR